MDGFLAVDKPSGITSMQAIDAVKRWLPFRCKLGHTGTLDPLATGVLVMGLGQATRLSYLIQDMQKSYDAVIRLGVRSNTDDIDGEVQEVQDCYKPELDTINNALSKFIGTIEQLPPKVSAIKLSGKRAYQLSRSGQEVNLSTRPVQIHDIQLLHYSWPLLSIKVLCGKGTYIRALARDLGNMLNCGGIIQELRRVQVGTFQVDFAHKLTELPSWSPSHISHLDDLQLQLPSVQLSPIEIERFHNGQTLKVSSSLNAVTSQLVILDSHQRIMGIAEVLDKTSNVIVPKICLKRCTIK
jgi:tRNA pseudouridine55 synthase